MDPGEPKGRRSVFFAPTPLVEPNFRSGPLRLYSAAKALRAPRARPLIGGRPVPLKLGRAANQSRFSKYSRFQGHSEPWITVADRCSPPRSHADRCRVGLQRLGLAPISFAGPTGDHTPSPSQGPWVRHHGTTTGDDELHQAGRRKRHAPAVATPVKWAFSQLSRLGKPAA